jgi:hypothetical protein
MRSSPAERFRIVATKDESQPIVKPRRCLTERAESEILRPPEFRGFTQHSVSLAMRSPGHDAKMRDDGFPQKVEKNAEAN